MQQETLDILSELAQRSSESAREAFEQLDLKRDIGEQLNDLREQINQDPRTEERKRLQAGFEKWATAHREETLNWLVNLDVFTPYPSLYANTSDTEKEDGGNDIDNDELFSEAVTALATNLPAWKESLYAVFRTFLERAEAEPNEDRARATAEVIADIDWLQDDDGTEEVGPQAHEVARFLKPWLDSPRAAVRATVADAIGTYLEPESPFLETLIDMARNDRNKDARTTARKSLQYAELLPEDLQPSAFKKLLMALPVIGWFVHE